MKFKLFAVSLVALPSLFSAQASVILEGDYVRTAVSDNGTLGYGSNTSPGLLHDPTGTGTFGVNDYLTPGSPWEFFGVDSDQTGNVGNNNTNPSGNVFTSSSLTDTSGSVYDNSVNWTGTYSTFLTVSTNTYFNDDSEYVSFMTTITALTDLTNLSFLRAIDPDMPSGASTLNNRGFGDLAAEDWVNSENVSNGLTLGLYSISNVSHNTGITAWTTDHDHYLSGTDLGDGDNTIGIAFDLADLAAGESISFDYHYVMGDTPESVDIPEVSEPAGLAMLALGLLGFAARRARK